MTTATPASLLEVQSLDHVTIVAADLDRTRAFYVGILGMREVHRPHFGFPGLWFQTGTTQIHVNVAGSECGGRAGIPDGQACTPSQGFHIAFSVEDGPEAARRLAQAGFKIIDGPRLRPDGVHQFYLYDPDGHLIEICSFSPTPNPTSP